MEHERTRRTRSSAGALEALLATRVRAQRDRLASGLLRMRLFHEVLGACAGGPVEKSRVPGDLLDALAVVRLAATSAIELVDDLLDSPSGDFHAWVQADGEMAHVVLVGELDVSTASVLDDALGALMGAPGDVVVHLHLLSFLDCAGIAPLVRLAKDRSSRGGLVRARGATARQRMILELTPVVCD